MQHVYLSTFFQGFSKALAYLTEVVKVFLGDTDWNVVPHVTDMMNHVCPELDVNLF